MVGRRISIIPDMPIPDAPSLVRHLHVIYWDSGELEPPLDHMCDIESDDSADEGGYSEFGDNDDEHDGNISRESPDAFAPIAGFLSFIFFLPFCHLAVSTRSFIL